MTKKQKIKIKHWDYCGKVKNGKPHGNGELKGRGEYPISINRFHPGIENEMNKFKYQGSFKNGKMDGYGVLSAYSTTSIDIRGERIGNNRLDSKYEGEFKSGFKHGKGTLRTKKTITTGQWKNGKLFGYVEQKIFRVYDSVYNEIIRGVFDKSEKCNKGNWICKGNDQVLEYEGSLHHNTSPNGKGILKAIDKKLKVYFIIESNFINYPHSENGKTIRTFYKDNKFKEILYKQKLEVKDLYFQMKYGKTKDIDITNKDHLKLLKLYERFWEKYTAARPYE